MEMTEGSESESSSKLWVHHTEQGLDCYCCNQSREIIYEGRLAVGPQYRGGGGGRYG